MMRVVQWVAYWLGYWSMVAYVCLWRGWLRLQGHSTEEARDILSEWYRERLARAWAAQYLQGSGNEAA